MNIDNLDLQIIYHILNQGTKVRSTYSLGVKIFKKDRDVEDKNRNDSLVRSRLKKLEKYGLIQKINNDNSIIYLLDENNVVFDDLIILNLKINQKSCFLKIDEEWYVYPFNNS